MKNTDNNDQKLMTVAQAARRYGVSETRLRSDIRSGYLKPTESRRLPAGGYRHLISPSDYTMSLVVRRGKR